MAFKVVVERVTVELSVLVLNTDWGPSLLELEYPTFRMRDERSTSYVTAAAKLFMFLIVCKHEKYHIDVDVVIIFG